MARKIPLERIGEIVQAVLRELKEAGGQAKLRDLFEQVEPKLSLNEYEKSTYQKSGFTRWRTIVHFRSIGLVKAGYIQKSAGKWILTKPRRGSGLPLHT